MGAVKRWTDAALLDALRALEAETGRVPRVYDLSPADARRAGHAEAVERWERMGLPHYRTVAQRFGSLPRALEAAGIVGGPRRQRRYRDWDRASIRDALVELAVELGHSPRAVDLNPTLAAERGDREAVRRFRRRRLPYIATVVRHYGSLNAALDAAGLPTRTNGGQRREVAA